MKTKPIGWTACKLRDVLKIKHGFAFAGEYFGPRGPYALVTPGNFFESGGFKNNGAKQKRYDGPVPRDYVLAPGALIVAMTEQGEGLLGSAALVPNGDIYLHNQRIGLVESDVADRHFIYYLMNSEPVRLQIRATCSGTKVRHTSPSRIGEAMVNLPPILDQKRIVDVLSAYDDLIDVNQRRIVILEEMALRLFKEWFIRFRYPGHEAVPLVETELELAPEGWKPSSVGNISSYVSRGLAPKYDDQGESWVVSQKCIRDQTFSLRPARRQSKAVPEEKVLRQGDILINSTGVGTLGRVAQVIAHQENVTADTHVTIVRRARDVPMHFFGLQLLQRQSDFERQGIGSTGQTELSRNVIKDTPILVPPQPLMEKFSDVVAPMREESEILRQQNTRLRATRDLLLPKLIAGEIDVSRAERRFAEAAE